MATFIEGVTDIFPEPKFFTPDFSFIDKMLKRKEDMYEEGFSKLNNKYNLINREVTNAANAQIRDEFLRKAKMNLKDLAALDLSDPSNVAAAADVFKPFYTNTNVIGDQSLTQHWNQQTAIGNSFRLKEGGKEFSQDNLDYINQQRMAFAADDPSSVNSYAQAKRYYTPYYDYNKEYKEAMKDFKPSHTKIDKINGMYIKTIDDKSWNKLEIAQYLNSVLSDKAKQQLRIEAAVRIGNNPSSLAQAYMQTEGAELPKLNNLITKLDSELASEKDPKKIEQLKKYKSYYEDQRLEIGNNLKMIRSGDVNFLKKNSEAIAYKAYYNSMIEKIANGYSHTDIEQSIKSDDVAKMYYEQDQQWKRLYYSEAKQDERERKKAEAEKTKTWSEKVDVEMGGTDLEVYSKQLQDDFNAASDNRNRTFSNLMSKIGDDLNKSASEVTQEDYMAWINNPNNKRSKLFEEYQTAHQAYQIAEQSISINKKSKNDYFIEKMGKDNYQLYNSIYEIFNTINREEVNRGYATVQDPFQEAAKILNISTQQVRDIVDSGNDVKKQYQKNVDQPMTKNIPGYFLQPTDSRYQLGQGFISGIAGVKDAGGVQYFPSSDPSKFVVAFDVPGESDEKKEERALEIKNKIELAGKGRKATYNPDTKRMFITGVSEKFAKDIDPYYNIPNIHRGAITNLENSVDPKTVSPFLLLKDAAGNDHNINLTKNMYMGRTIYGLIIDGKKMNYEFENPIDPYNVSVIILSDPIKSNYIH